MSNPAVDIEEPTTPVDSVTAAVPAVTFVSGFDNEDDNLVQQTAAADNDDDEEEENDVNDEVPLVAADDIELVRTSAFFFLSCTTKLAVCR